MNIYLKKRAEELAESFYNGNREFVIGELEMIAKEEPLVAIWLSLEIAKLLGRVDIPNLQRSVEYKWSRK